MGREFWVVVILVFAGCVAYGQVAGHGFVDLDDDQYVFENPHVRGGLTWEGVGWAFTTMWMANWHPLTWLSHMVDCELFGLDAGYHHLMGVLLHLVNGVLLFFVLRRMTGAVWRSGMVVALFLLHPLHVESVAWVAERKDVLSTLFFLLTLWAYAGYAARPGWARYGLVVAFLGLGLLAKPMLVTVPFVLLLLDDWPLERFGKAGLKRLVGEKVPLFLMAAASSVVTFVAQHRGGAMGMTYGVPFGTRVENALVSYVSYLWKMVWPVGLGVFYPYRIQVPALEWLGALAVLVGISMGVIWASRRRPYLGVGWLWYLGTLVPVIGLVQVGEQAMADRYTYVPLIGVFVMGVWGVGELVASRRRVLWGAVGLVGVVLLGCMVRTWIQVGYWKNGITLFEHALEVAQDSALAHNNLGVALAEEGKLEESIPHYQQALQINPRYERAHYNLGLAMARQGKLDDAMTHYQEALRINPRFSVAHNNLGVMLAQQGRQEEAIAHYREALRFTPDHVTAHFNLGLALAVKGEPDEAIFHYREALRLDPKYADAHDNLGIVLASQGKFEEAITHYRQALRLNPESANAYYNLGVVLARQNKFAEAIDLYKESIRIDPAYINAYYNLGTLLVHRGEHKQAIAYYREAIRLKPDDPASLNDLAWILATHPDPGLRNGPEAVELAQKACDLWSTKDPNLLDTLAAAYAEAGRFPEAIATLRGAISLVAGGGPKGLVAEFEKHLRLYETGRPYREGEVSSAAQP